MATRTKEGPKQPADETKHNAGKVVQVIGPVLDVEFEPEHLPEIYNAVVIDHRGNGEGGGTPAIRSTAEVQHHISPNQLRDAAMTSADGAPVVAADVLLHFGRQADRGRAPPLTVAA